MIAGLYLAFRTAITGAVGVDSMRRFAATAAIWFLGTLAIVVGVKVWEYRIEHRATLTERARAEVQIAKVRNEAQAAYNARHAAALDQHATQLASADVTIKRLSSAHDQLVDELKASQDAVEKLNQRLSVEAKKKGQKQPSPVVWPKAIMRKVATNDPANSNRSYPWSHAGVMYSAERERANARAGVRAATATRAYRVSWHYQRIAAARGQELRWSSIVGGVSQDSSRPRSAPIAG
jgi:hypothetical protein